MDTYKTYYWIIFAHSKLWKPTCLLVCYFMFYINGNCQSKYLSDSIKFSKINISQNKFINNLFHKAVNSIEKTPPTKQDIKLKQRKSEDPFLPYQGKIIRHIFINPYNFDCSLNDTNKHDIKKITKLGKKIHTLTKEFVIKDNLFIKENTPLNAFKLADNERYLRTLEFLHDARFIVNTIANNPDSIDIRVLTIDVFSIAIDISSDWFNHIYTNAYDNNLGGMGQHLDLSYLYDFNRTPRNGFSIFYRKDNLFHSFFDATAGYGTINGNSFTNEEETTAYITVSRQLISPYSKIAGAITISHNEAYNVYNKPVPSFYKYKYNLFDAWGGYNLALKKLTANNNTKRNRRFLALRYYNRYFTETPKQVETFNPVYNSSSAVLAQITFFRQDYYKTQYIYGFGNTEDLPYGYNLSATVGWHQQLNMDRFYSGINAFKYLATAKGDFIQFYLKTGGFLYHNNWQDASYLIGVSAFSRILYLHNTKLRQYVNLNYSCINNIVTYAPLRIDNYYGVRGFNTDSAYGTKRLSIQSETEFFLNFSFLGFRFAPFAFMDFSVLTPQNQPFQQSLLYSSLGGGIRMRNESLVFETIELRAYFFPIAPDHMNGFRIDLNSNIRYRYISNFIKAPDLIQLNTQ